MPDIDTGQFSTEGNTSLRAYGYYEVGKLYFSDVIDPSREIITQRTIERIIGKMLEAKSLYSIHLPQILSCFIPKEGDSKGLEQRSRLNLWERIVEENEQILPFSVNPQEIINFVNFINTYCKLDISFEVDQHAILFKRYLQKVLEFGPNLPVYDLPRRDISGGVLFPSRPMEVLVIENNLALLMLYTNILCETIERQFIPNEDKSFLLRFLAKSIFPESLVSGKPTKEDEKKAVLLFSRFRVTEMGKIGVRYYESFNWSQILAIPSTRGRLKYFLNRLLGERQWIEFYETSHNLLIRATDLIAQGLRGCYMSEKQVIPHIRRIIIIDARYRNQAIDLESIKSSDNHQNILSDVRYAIRIYRAINNFYPRRDTLRRVIEGMLRYNHLGVYLEINHFVSLYPIDYYYNYLGGGLDGKGENSPQ